MLHSVRDTDVPTYNAHQYVIISYRSVQGVRPGFTREHVSRVERDDRILVFKMSF